MYITYCNTFTNMALNDVTSLALSQNLLLRQTLLSMSKLAINENSHFVMCDEVCDKCLSMSYFFGQMSTKRLLYWLNRPTIESYRRSCFTRRSASIIMAATRTGV